MLLTTEIEMNLEYWVCTAITPISAAVSFGYAVGGLRASDQGSRTPSLYALSRSAALFAVAIAAPFTESVGFVAAAAVAMVIVQAGDAVIGWMIHDRFKTIGPATTATVNLAALVWLLAD